MTTTADEFSDLEAWLAGDDDLPPEAARPDEAPLLVEHLDDANRRLRSIARLARDEATIKDVAAAEVARIKAWSTDRLAGVERRRTWLMDGLEAFTRAYAAANGVKSVNVPNGVLRLKKAPLVVADPWPSTDLAALGKAHPDLVRVTYALDKNVVKERCRPGAVNDEITAASEAPVHHAVVKATGEIVPGVYFVVDPDPRFSLTPTKDLA